MSIIRNRSRLGKSLLAVVAAVGVLGVGGFAAYKYFFNRPGEAAVLLIPADADMVITVDTTPSERQLTTFKQIGDALREQGLLEKLDKTLEDALKGAPVAAEIRPYVSQSYAMAMWMPENVEAAAEPEMVVLMATNNPTAVSASLAKHGTASDAAGLQAYTFKDGGDVSVAVIQDYLAIAPKASYLSRIKKVVDGGSTSLASQAEYQAARSELPQDSNFMLFMSPKAMKKMEGYAGGAGMGMYSSAKWMSFGFSLRPTGLEMGYRCPYDAAKFPALKTLSSIKPVSESVMKKLPAGAYGVMAYSEAGKYWQFFKEAMASEKEVEDMFEEGVATFEKETGLSVEKDVVPALGGNLALAVYPAPGNEEKSIDIVLMIDDANGANPAEFVAKLRALAEKESAEAGDPIKFEVSERDGAKVYSLDAASEAKLKEGMTGGPAMTEPTMPEPNMQMPNTVPPAPQPTPGDDFLQGKTFAYAEVGNAVVITSSQAMLNQTLETMRGAGKNLSDDASFTGMVGEMNKEAQSYLLVDLRRVMERLRPLMEEGLEGAPITVDDIVNMFGESGTGLIATGRYDGEVAVGEMFLPLDYVRCIKMIGAAVKSAEPNPAGIGDAPPIIAEPMEGGETIVR